MSSLNDLNSKAEKAQEQRDAAIEKLKSGADKDASARSILSENIASLKEQIQFRKDAASRKAELDGEFAGVKKNIEDVKSSYALYREHNKKYKDMQSELNKHEEDYNKLLEKKKELDAKP